jgi:hypothetical protein
MTLAKLALTLVLALVAGGCATKPEDVVYRPEGGNALFLVGVKVTQDIETNRVSYKLNFMRSSIRMIDSRNYALPILNESKEFAKLLGSARQGGKTYHLYEGTPGDYALTAVNRTLTARRSIYHSRSTYRERGQAYFNTWSFRVERGTVSYIGDLEIDLDRDPPLLSHVKGGEDARIALREFKKIRVPFRRTALLSKRFAPVGFDPRRYTGTPVTNPKATGVIKRSPNQGSTTAKSIPVPKINAVKPRVPAAGIGDTGLRMKALMKKFLAGEISQAAYPFWSGIPRCGAWV